MMTSISMMMMMMVREMMTMSISRQRTWQMSCSFLHLFWHFYDDVDGGDDGDGEIYLVVLFLGLGWMNWSSSSSS